MDYSIIVSNESSLQKQVLRGGYTCFVPGDKELLITDVQPVPYQLDAFKVLYDINTGEYINAGAWIEYRIWCSHCYRYYDIRDVNIPTLCPVCLNDDIINVTEEQFALRGYPAPVALTQLRGHHLSQFDSRGRWTTYMDFVPFYDMPESIPDNISFSDVFMDGMADLNVMDITIYGFKYRVTSVGPKNTFGTVEFNWEGIYG
jgi:uncharacterized protein YbaR (Trm112 family)